MSADTIPHTTRRIVQISSASVDNNVSTQANAYVFALCDDGTVWCAGDTHSAWFQMPTIPQATRPTAEIIAQDRSGALAWVNGEIVYLVGDRRCRDCGHPVSGREIDPTPKVVS